MLTNDTDAAAMPIFKCLWAVSSRLLVVGPHVSSTAAVGVGEVGTVIEKRERRICSQSCCLLARVTVNVDAMHVGSGVDRGVVRRNYPAMGCTSSVAIDAAVELAVVIDA